MLHTAPRDELQALIRARILSEAARIIGAGGVAALSMRGLAERVGLSAGALHRLYPTKQAILVAYCLEALEVLHHQLRNACAGEVDPRLALRRMLVAYGAFALQDRDRFRVLFLEDDMGLLDDLSSHSTIFDAYHLLHEHVTMALRAGFFRPLPVDTIARALWASVHGVVTLALNVTEIDFTDAGDLVAIAADAALRGFSAGSDGA